MPLPSLMYGLQQWHSDFFLTPQITGAIPSVVFASVYRLRSSAGTDVTSACVAMQKKEQARLKERAKQRRHAVNQRLRTGKPKNIIVFLPLLAAAKCITITLAPVDGVDSNIATAVTTNSGAAAACKSAGCLAM